MTFLSQADVVPRRKCKSKFANSEASEDSKVADVHVHFQLATEKDKGSLRNCLMIAEGIDELVVDA